MKKAIGLLVIALVIAIGVSNTVAAPLLQATTKSLSTNFTVQNLGSTVANVQVDYLRQYNGTSAGGTWTADPGNTTFDLDPSESKVVAQYLDTTLTSGAGSATVSSNNEIAAIVNILAREQTPTSGSYTAFNEGASSFYAPAVFKNLPSSVGNINSQLIIMNVGGDATSASVVFIDGVTFAPVYTKTISNIPAGESYYYDQSMESNLSDGFYGAAEVRAAAGGSIAVVGNQFTGANGLLTYPGFPEGKTDWSIPLYVSRLLNGYNSVIVIQNVSGSTIAAGDIDVEFTPDASLGETAFTVSSPAALPNNASWFVNPRANSQFPVDSYGAAKVMASGDVVVMVNQLVNEPPNYSDSALSFNAIPADLTGTKVVAPLIMSRLTSNNYSTVWTIANLTDSAGTCNFTYYPHEAVGGANITVSGVTLPASGSIVHNHRLDGATTHKLPLGWYGSGEVECTQPVAGVVNQIQAGGAGDPDLSYNAFTTTASP